MDLANALNIASILWCSLSPSALIFRLDLEASENDLKKWKNISVGISPIFSRRNSASHTIQLRPPKSKATCAKQSSWAECMHSVLYLAYPPTLGERVRPKQYPYLRWYDAHRYADHPLL